MGKHSSLDVQTYGALREVPEWRLVNRVRGGREKVQILLAEWKLTPAHVLAERWVTPRRNICLHIYIYVYMCMWICTQMYLYICVYICIGKH